MGLIFIALQSTIVPLSNKRNVVAKLIAVIWEYCGKKFDKAVNMSSKQTIKLVKLIWKQKRSGQIA